jgi:predicted AAA+ superfamily ATPase
VVDNGFVTAKAVQNSPNSGKLMENLVFTELVKQGNEPGRELFYYHTRNQKEVDFVIKKGNEVLELIQVCYDLRNPEVEQREVRALVEAGKELGLDRLTILTWNDAREIKKDDITIQCTPLHEWLLDLNKS